MRALRARWLAGMRLDGLRAWRARWLAGTRLDGLRAWRARWLAGTRLDGLLAVAIAVELELECWFGATPTTHRPLDAIAVVFFTAPIVVRRRWPARALVCSSAALTTQALLGGQLGTSNGISTILTLALLAYSVGALLDVRHGLAALGLAGAIFTGFVSHTEPGSSGALGTALFVLSAAFAAPWFVGRMARERARRAAAFRELAAQAAAEHAERERGAIAQERARIGLELQDIIAHSVSAMVIQAGGARRLLRSDPQRARASILTVESTGREALGELRRLLGMLRKDEDPRALAPQPGLDQVASLVESARDAGIACELRSVGEPVELTPGVDLVGYRVIEAVLASVLSHRSRRAAVAIRYQRRGLELEVSGDGAPGDLELQLRSVAERVALYNGSLETRPGGDDTFSVHARLPLEAPLPA
jgi:signal transduction histidine kinase